MVPIRSASGRQRALVESSPPSVHGYNRGMNEEKTLAQVMDPLIAKKYEREARERWETRVQMEFRANINVFPSTAQAAQHKPGEQEANLDEQLDAINELISLLDRADPKNARLLRLLDRADSINERLCLIVREAEGEVGLLAKKLLRDYAKLH